MEPELDGLEPNVAVSQSVCQGFDILLPISQNAFSTQEANIQTSLLTPVQKARIARQKEMALARRRERHEQHHQPPQRHDKTAMAFSPCTQLPSSQQGFDILLPISQNAFSPQEANIQTSLLTPVQKARIARQKEMALARRRERHEQHHRPPQRHDKTAMAFSPCTQLPSSQQAHKKRAADMLNNFPVNAETTLQDTCKKDDCALDHYRLKRKAQDDSDEPAYVHGSTASYSDGWSENCEMPQSEQDIQACYLAFSNFCSNGKQGLTRSAGGTFEVTNIYKPALTCLSEEDGGMKIKHECRQTGKAGGKGADTIELSDDGEVRGKAVVIELLDDDDSSLKADMFEVSRVDGASQNMTSSATLDSLYQTENRRMQGLEDKGTNVFQSELYNLEENEDDISIPLTVLPSSLSRQQQLVLKAAAEGKSIFLTGAAGTGKSFLLGFVIDILRRRLGQESVFVAASTGLAACALNGTTIHSFAGIGLGKENVDVLASKVLGSREAMNRWRNARALIIDEVSMIDGELFDKLDYVAKVVRAEFLRDEPLSKSFGGIQLIVTGDFFQLPPVKPVNQQKFFAFEAGCWDKCFDVQIELKQIFRQDDENFVGMLNKIRRGTHTPETLLPLQRCIRDLPENGSGIEATRLYPLKHDVNKENLSTLRMLNREIIKFTALDQASSSYYQSMLQNMRTRNTLPLCIGAQVMLVKNLDPNSGLVNGARGVVVGFSSNSVLHDKDVDVKAVTAAISPNDQWPIVHFVCDASQRVIGPHKDSIKDGGREVASRIQVPLILAWALSVHKCQGMTLDRVKMDLSRAFGFGMVYVALSRVKNMTGLQLTGLDPSTIKAHPRVVDFYTKLDNKVLIF